MPARLIYLLSFLFLSKAMSSPVSEIKSAFGQWTDAYNRGNIEGYLEGYADLPTIRYVSGKNVIIGKEEICKVFKEKGTKGFLELVHFEAECFGANAICFGKYKLTEDLKDGKEKEIVHEGCFTVHVQKLNGQWKIISDHSS
jgi:ketosteroid isomerase-like protein